ncbi:MAG: hydantoinase/oxoprolinase family protein [Halarsenatibacteraceae bacterium]
MTELALGIDTGGTFTDGVVINLKTEEIIVATKQVTTRNDLTVAIDNCLKALLSSDKFHQEDIKLVSLSTTLATNAIVEGQGAEVGAILIGFNSVGKLPTRHQATVAGGCTIKGKIKAEINSQEIIKKVNEMKDKVDAFAVCGYLSVRNPVQEKAVAKMIEEETGYPVVQGHSLSSELGFQERANTAVFNARLLPLITDLITAVEEKLEAHQLNAPLMVVKGDGSLISAEEAKRRPIETSLSGPAASVIGARQLANIDDGIIIDIGGTTTDLALLKDGQPGLSEAGARVGGWLTRVKAAKITTIGLGGDSQIRVDQSGQLEIGPERVFPLAWAAEKYPHLIDELKTIKAEDYFPINHQPVSVLTYIKDPVKYSLSAVQKEIIKKIKEKPHTIRELGRILDIDPEVLPWQQLVKTGCLHRAGLTPTDMLHWQDKYLDWNKEAACLAVEITARRKGMPADKFVDLLEKEIEIKLGSLIIESILRDETDKLDFKSREVEYFYRKLLEHNDDAMIDFKVELSQPLVGVGAPARAYFPGTVERISAELYLPEWAEVANAVGTVMGKIIERVKIVIKPDEVGAGYAVHTPEERLGYKRLETALETAEKLGKELVKEKAEKSAAKDIEIFIDREDKYGRFSGGREEDRIFIETVLEISAVGKPW